MYNKAVSVKNIMYLSELLKFKWNMWQMYGKSIKSDWGLAVRSLEDHMLNQKIEQVLFEGNAG